MHARVRSVLLVVVLTALLATPQVSAATTGTTCGGSRWVGSWSASMGYVNDVGYAMQTLRMIVAPHLAGTTARVRLTNPLVDHPVTIPAARLGRSASGGAALVPGSNRELRFAGKPAVTIPARGTVVSDPVKVRVAPFRPLAVSLYVAAPTGAVSEHFDGHQLSWIAPGPMAADETGVPFLLPTFKWTLLGGVDVYRASGARSVVALGDSITDGFQDVPAQLQTMGANHRYPDFLTRRLVTAGQTGVSVLNAGISGNEVTRDAGGHETLLGFGPSALHRLERDVLRQPGVSHVIVMAGTNDLSQDPPQPAGAIIAGLRRIVERVHAAGLKIHLGTLPPRNDVSAGQVSALNRVNRWIRGQRVADGVVDFHAVLRDPNEPDRLNPQYDSGDGLHPSSAGYEAMANAVSLKAITAPRCRSV